MNHGVLLAENFAGHVLHQSLHLAAPCQRNGSSAPARWPRKSQGAGRRSTGPCNAARAPRPPGTGRGFLCATHRRQERTFGQRTKLRIGGGEGVPLAGTRFDERLVEPLTRIMPALARVDGDSLARPNGKAARRTRHFRVLRRGPWAAVVHAHVEQQAGIGDLAELWIVLAVRSEEVSAARRQRHFGEAIGSTGSSASARTNSQRNSQCGWNATSFGTL